jgi:hypothetical protein
MFDEHKKIWNCNETIFTWINANFEVNLKLKKSLRYFGKHSHVTSCHITKWHKLHASNHTICVQKNEN